LPYRIGGGAAYYMSWVLFLFFLNIDSRFYDSVE
jgi:hypothetical protein